MFRGQNTSTQIIICLGLCVAMVRCQQPVSHFFSIDDLPPEGRFRVTAGGLVKLNWNMEWRDFEPKLRFHLKADVPTREMPCRLTGETGIGQNGARWIGLRVAADCPATTVPLLAFVMSAGKRVMEQKLQLEILRNTDVLGVPGRFSPPDGEPNSRRRGWRLIDNFTRSQSLTIGEEQQLKRGKLMRRCMPTPPAPPSPTTSPFIDNIYANCLGGQSQLINPVVLPKVVQKNASPPSLKDQEQPLCAASFGGPANSDSAAYAPQTGTLGFDFDFSPTAAFEDQLTLGCRVLEYFRGPQPSAAGGVRAPDKKGRGGMPLSRDLRKYNRLTFMARAPLGDPVWLGVSLSYWSQLSPQPKESLTKDFRLSERWRRYEVDLDFGLWVDASQRKRLVAINFDVFRERLSCNGTRLQNPRSGRIELANLFFIENGVDANVSKDEALDTAGEPAGDETTKQ